MLKKPINFRELNKLGSEERPICGIYQDAKHNKQAKRPL
jgi:hypothetical protein